MTAICRLEGTKVAKGKPKISMPVSERAKQFSPFAALKGLPEALAAKEKVRVQRRILSEESAEALNQQIVSLKCGQIITAIYYEPNEQEYLQLTGMVAKIDASSRTLQIVQQKIPFDDLFELII